MRLSLFLILFAGLLVGIALTEDDNEFADFEFDADETEVKNPAKEQKTTETFMETDTDDGVVEIEDEFDHFSDNDEFEGFGGSDSDGNQELPDTTKKGGEPKLQIAKVPLHFRNWDSYWIELIFIAGLVVYFINYAMGKTKNIKIANNWLMAHRSFLEENFALVGDDGKKETDMQPAGLMIKESDSIFTLWCSGRVCCEGMLIELKLIKRQDLLSLSMGLLSAKVHDQVKIQVEISKDSMDSFVFAVCNKRSATKMFKDYPDLKQYCVSVAKPDEKYGIPTGYSVLSELAEASSLVLDTRVVAMLNKYKDIIESIHISDQYTGTMTPQDGEPQVKAPETKKMIILSFAIKTEMEEMKPLLQLVIYLMDKLKRFKLSREARTKADKNRVAIQQEYLKSLHSIRQEAAAQKNSEKRKLEKEKIMNEDNVERQVKLEKKMKRKDAKKAMPKMKSMSIHL